MKKSVCTIIITKVMMMMMMMMMMLLTILPLVISYIDLTLKCMIEIISGCLIYAKI